MNRTKLAVIVALVAACVAATARLAPVAPVAPVLGHRSITHLGLNPHLHGVAHVAPTLGVAHVGSYRWHGGWDSYAWFALHRGTGTVQGMVRNGEGSPMPGVDVRLRNANGHGLKSTAAKHITFTSSGGSFLMTRVRAGNYRVRAAQGKRNGHTAIHVHSGQVVTVTVKM